MKLPILITCCLFMLLASCKTINLHQSSQITTTQRVQLGSIGSKKDFILQKEFNSSAIPSYKEPIKLEVITKAFNKQSYKIFTKAKASQTADLSINYLDSIQNKPKYLQLQIADKVAVIKALNSNENHGIKDYLSHNTYAQVLTGISIVFNKKELESIARADAVFLVENGLKTYGLQLYKGNLKTQTMSFNDGIVFEYKASNCCWQENQRHQLNIVDLVGEYNNCPNKTYRSAQRAKKKINYYKF